MGIGSLSTRELEVLSASATGIGRRAVGESLCISGSTVANHLARIYTKLGVHSRLGAVGLAVGSGALEMDCARTPERLSDKILSPLLGAAREYLGMELAFIAEFSAGRRVYRYVDSSVPSAVQVGDDAPQEDSYCQRVLDGRLPEVILDAGQLPAALELPVTMVWPVGAYVNVPLILSDGRVYGAFCCASRRPDQRLGQHDLRVVRLFAQVARQYIESDLEAARQRRCTYERITSALTVEDCLSTVYQPVVALGDGAILGVEALSRFPEYWQCAPDGVFAQASSIGLGIELERRAVRQALVGLDELAENGFLSVNASPKAVVSGRLDDVLAEVDLRRVVLEVTEHAAVSDYERLATALRPHRRRGMRIAVDDAGAGYASFHHILRLKPEWIKLDVSITRHIDADPARVALASALIGFAKEIGSGIIAEGVETEAELVVMKRLGATGAQGYYLGRPRSLADAISTRSTSVAGIT